MKKPLKRLTGTFCASAVAVSLVLAGATSADAATLGGQSITSTQTNDSCVAAIKAAQARGASGLSLDRCTVTITTQTSAPTPVSAADLVDAKAAMSAGDASALAEAVASGTVRKKSYSQTEDQLTDQERQYGTFYYDGSHVWVTSQYRGVTGTHHCVVDFAVGYGISKNECSESGTTSKKELTMIWNVSLAVSGGPIAWTETYNMYVSASGGTSQ